MNDQKPIVSPVIALLNSRKTMVALATALVTIVVLLVPTLQPVQGELITVVTILGSILIASIAFEDGKEKGATTTVSAGSGDVTVNKPPDAAPPVAPDDTQGVKPIVAYFPDN